MQAPSTTNCPRPQRLSDPRFPPLEAFGRRPKPAALHQRPRQGRRPKPFTKGEAIHRPDVLGTPPRYPAMQRPSNMPGNSAGSGHKPHLVTRALIERVRKGAARGQTPGLVKVQFDEPGRNSRGSSLSALTRRHHARARRGRARGSFPLNSVAYQHRRIPRSAPFHPNPRTCCRCPALARSPLRSPRDDRDDRWTGLASQSSPRDRASAR